MTATSKYTQIAEKVRDLIQGLSLTSIPSANVVVTKLPWARDMAMPGIRVAYDQDKVKPSTNASVDVDYSLWVIYCRVSNQNLTESMDTPNVWRESIRALFEAKDIVSKLGITGVFNCRVVPATVESDVNFRSQYDVGALKVVVTAREIR